MTLLVRVLLIAALTFSSVVSAAAQSQVRLWSIAETGSIDAASEAVSLPAGARGLGTVGMQISGTFTGTIALQCSNDNTTWTALRLTPTSTTTAVTDVTTTGMWIGSMAGCQYVRAFSTAWTSDTAVVTLFATSSGGGAGSGGTVTFEGEISAFNGVLLDAVAGDAITDTANNALRVNVVTGVASGLTDAELRANPVPVSGTVTANLSATDNAVLDAIAVDTAFLETSKAPLAPGAATATTAFVTGGTYNATPVTLTDGQQSGVQLDAEGQLLVNNVDMLAALVAIQGATEGIESGLSVDVAHGNTFSDQGPQGMLEAADFDGAALPNAVAEGQAVRAKGTLSGVGLTMLVSEDGSLQYGTTTTPLVVDLGANNDVTAIPTAATTGGCTPNSSISTAAVMETEIKATAGQLYQLVITNLDATPVFARLYNDTAANTDQTDTPIQRFVVPTQGNGNGAGFVLPITIGQTYSTAITLRITTGAADTDTGALSANEVFVSYCYK
jgi:hypothetical protein